MSSPTAGTLHRRIASSLTARRETLACVEIGSGGRISQALTAEPGSSAFFTGALILTPDAALWPRAITGRGCWQAEPPGSEPRLFGLAAVAQKQFDADWGLAVECVPSATPVALHLALRSPDCGACCETAALAADAAEPDSGRLAQCVLERLAARLEGRDEAPP